MSNNPHQNIRYYIAFHVTILFAIHTCHPTGIWDGNFFQSASSSSQQPQQEQSNSASLSPGLTFSSFLVSSPNQITKRASNDQSTFVDCARGTEIRETCERCSKASRSRDAFAKCCQSPGEVRTFCQRLLNYTFPGRPRKLSRIDPRWWYLS